MRRTGSTVAGKTVRAEHRDAKPRKPEAKPERKPAPKPHEEA